MTGPSGPCGPIQDPETLATVMAARPENPDGVNIAPLLTKPEKVCIVCLGASSNDFVRDCMTTLRMKQPWDEIWTLNRGFRGFHHDKLFVMDDMRWLAKKDKKYGELMGRHNRPIVTSTVYPEFPMAVPYPYVQVRDKIQDDVFNVNTVSYMVAFAIYIGVKDITIFGADFFYANGNTAESGGQAVAFLLGGAKFWGFTYKLPNSTTLLYAHKVKQLSPGVIGRPPYGYHRRDELTDAEKGIPDLAVG